MKTLNFLHETFPSLAREEEAKELRDLAVRMATLTRNLLQEIDANPITRSRKHNEHGKLRRYDFQLRRVVWWILMNAGLVDRMGKMRLLKQDITLAQNNFLIRQDNYSFLESHSCFFWGVCFVNYLANTVNRTVVQSNRERKFQNYILWEVLKKQGVDVEVIEKEARAFVAGPV